MSEKIRLAAVSFAHGHIHAYIDSVKSFEDAEFVAAWDDDLERGKEQCERHGLVFEPDLDVLLKRDDIDAVFITSPTNKHAEHAVMAAQAGKHILLQKPMALTLEDCDRIIEAVNTSGIKFSMCYQMRVDAVNRQLKSLIDTGAVGNVAVIRRRHAIPVLLMPEFAYPGNWHIDPVQNMGMFMDDASHAADWFYWMLGRPTSVIAEIDNVVTDVAPDDNGVAVFRFAKGEMGILFNSSTQWAAQSTTEIYGDKGTIIHNYGDSPSTRVPIRAGAAVLKLYQEHRGDWQIFDFPMTMQGERIAAVPRPLIDYLKAEAPPLATAEDGKVTVEMVLAAYKAASEGIRVKL